MPPVDPTPAEIERLQWAIRAALSSPLLDDIQGFAWEAVFHFAKNLPLRDPLSDGKSKRLFDAVDARNKIGWSLKAKQCGSAKSMRIGMRIEFVIQRADAFSKSNALGFLAGLSKIDPPAEIGRAVTMLWNLKVEEDVRVQGIEIPKLAILLKSPDRRHLWLF
jgi:hypothetical protein